MKRQQICACMIAVLIWTHSSCIGQEPDVTAEATLPDVPLLQDASALTASERALVELKTMHGAPEAFVSLRRKMAPSLGDTLNWSASELADALSLTDRQVSTLDQYLAKRKLAKNANLKVACEKSLKVDITKKDVALKLEGELTESERAAEKELLEAVDELLSPQKVKLLVVYLISTHHLTFSKIPFVRDYLKLTDDQVRRFEEANKFVDECSRQQERKGLDPSDLRDYKEITTKIAKANDSLSVEQFEYWARACKLLPPESSLKDFLQSSTEEQKRKLIRHRPACAEILTN